MKELEKQIAELRLLVQQLEEKITKLEEGELGSGVYVDGCTDATKAYITEEKEGKE